MRAVAAVIVVVGACYSPAAPRGVPCGDNDACPSGQQCIAGFCGGNGAAVDAEVAVDTAPPDMLPLCATWQAEHFDACLLPAPIGDLNLPQALSDFTWNTSTGELTGRMGTVLQVATTVMAQTDGPDVLLASVESFNLDAGSNLVVSGSRPLLIAASGTITIAGTFEVDASLGTPGPGGYGAAVAGTPCGAAPTGDSGAAGSPATGAGGGAFQGNGGAGGNTGGGPGTSAGAPTVIVGGCGGGTGGASTGGTTASRGAGGGALQLSAREGITIAATGIVDAGGGGGTGGRFPLGGAGGGGAGGYVGLDAPTVTIAGAIAANGGSGGGGASDVANGTNGIGGSRTAAAVSGGAGAATSNVGTCGGGGASSGGGVLDGATGASSACGGGGGGGGAGYIVVWSPALTVSGIVSPPVSGGM